MKCDTRIPIEEAAARMEVTPQHLRLGLQQNRYPFGTAVLNPGGRWSYNIVRKRFEQYMEGLDMRRGGEHL